MCSHRIGCLAVVDSNSRVIGVVSERDYINKVAVLGKNATETKVKEICTQGEANLVSVSATDTVDAAMEKMLSSDIRHLLIREDNKPGAAVVGMISVKDLVKCVVDKHSAQINRLEDIVLTQDMLRYQM
jgi:CBS domain-containing protein